MSILYCILYIAHICFYILFREAWQGQPPVFLFKMFYNFQFFILNKYTLCYVKNEKGIQFFDKFASKNNRGCEPLVMLPLMLPWTYSIFLHGLAPACLLNEFSHPRDIHPYNTRHRDLLHLPLARTTKYQGSFGFRGAKIWNTLSLAMRSKHDLNKFILA